MKLRSLALATALCAASVPAAADSIDFNLHNDALRFTYAKAMPQHKGLMLDAGLLYNENNNGSDDNLYHVGLNVFGQNWNKQGTFDIGIGGRMIYSSIGNGTTDLMAVGIGGQLRFSPVTRIGVGGSAYFAPQILSTLDAESYSEITLRADYQLLPQAFVYAGYRTVKVDIENGDSGVELDDEAHVGFKLLF